MPMEENLVDRLRAGDVGAVAGDNVNWFDRPNATPALVMTKVDPGSEWTMDGPDGLDEPRIRFECWGSTKVQVAALARALRGEMQQMADVGDTRFHPASLDYERWDRPDDLAGGIALFRITMDFTFFQEEITT